MELKYLFSAHFKDGSVIRQTLEDVSNVDPKKSAFFDVLQRIDDLVWFSLENGLTRYSVNLEDGRFAVESLPIEAQPSEQPMPEGGKYKLIYWRDHKHVFNQEWAEKSHEVAYRFGWEYTVDGKSWTQTMVVR
jgi:hypothetical protein